MKRIKQTSALQYKEIYHHPCCAEEMALTKLNDEMPLQMKLVGKEQELTEKNNGFLQNIDVAEGTVQKQVRAELPESFVLVFGPWSFVLSGDFLRLVGPKDEISKFRVWVNILLYNSSSFDLMNI